MPQLRRHFVPTIHRAFSRPGVVIIHSVTGLTRQQLLRVGIVMRGCRRGRIVCAV
ncbi:hypothetical protein BDR22DRAFT_835605 [Usnea florida]